jgi:hypothetical protein
LAIQYKGDVFSNELDASEMFKRLIVLYDGTRNVSVEVWKLNLRECSVVLVAGNSYEEVVWEELEGRG